MREKSNKYLSWIGDSREKIREFPKEVKDNMGYALREVQQGKKPVSVKP